MVSAISRDLIATQKAILQSIPPAEWRGAFRVLEALTRGARRWQDSCCQPASCAGSTRHDAG